MGSKIAIPDILLNTHGAVLSQMLQTIMPAGVRVKPAPAAVVSAHYSRKFGTVAFHYFVRVDIVFNYSVE
jgi:glycopeptide antibiotics resistance protein